LFDRLLLPLAKIGQRQRSPFPGERLRNGVSQAPLIGNTQDEGKPALQQFGHEFLQFKPRKPAAGFRTPATACPWTSLHHCIYEHMRACPQTAGRIRAVNARRNATHAWPAALSRSFARAKSAAVRSAYTAAGAQPAKTRYPTPAVPTT